MNLQAPPYVITGTVTSERTANGLISVSTDDAFDNFNVANDITVRTFKQQRVNPGDWGLIIFSDANDFNSGFWLGNLYKRFATKEFEDVEDTQTNNSSTLRSENKASLITASPTNVMLQHRNAKVNLDQNALYASVDNSNLILDKNNFTIQAENGKLSIGNGSLLNSNNTLTVTSSKDLNVTSDGNIIIKGRSGNFASSFIADAQDVSLNAAGGMIKMTANQYDLSIGSSIAAMKGSDAATTRIAQGNYKLITAEGSIDIISINPLRTVEIGNIQKVLGSGTYASFTASSTIIGAKVAFGAVKSKISLTRAGTMTAEASTSINMTTDLGPIQIKSPTNIKLASAMINIVAQALMQIGSSSTAMTNIASAVLDLTESKMINFGSKTVVPSVTGPCTSLTNCVFAGMPHAGSIATG